MKYPLTLSFKKIALAPQISVLDADGQLLFYVKQKLLKLKEAITVYADRDQTQALYTINADRVIDFSARYHFRDQNGMDLGSIKRQGMRSMWKARYEIDGASEKEFMFIQEENGWVKVVDGLFSEIPILGWFTGYVFNPTYVIARADGSPAYRLAKQPAFLESSFTIEKLAELPAGEELTVLLGILMMILLERSRG